MGFSTRERDSSGLNATVSYQSCRAPPGGSGQAEKAHGARDLHYYNRNLGRLSRGCVLPQFGRFFGGMLAAQLPTSPA